MSTREGNKTPTGSEIDDWFDLLDHDSVKPPKQGAVPDAAAAKVSEVPSAEDSWDWDLTPPATPSSPPAAAPSKPPAAPPSAAPAGDEFTDFGLPPMPPPSASVPRAPLGEISKRFQGTMMFGLTPTPEEPDPPAATVPAAPKAASVAPPPPLPPAATPMRGRTPIPRTAIPRAVGEGFAVPAPVGRPPLKATVAEAPSPPTDAPKSAATATLDALSGDLDDLEFGDVEPRRAPSRRPSQRLTPVVVVPEVTLPSLLTPVVDKPVPSEARRTPVPGTAPAKPPSLMPPSTRREMVDRFDLGDFTGALSLAETLLEIDRRDQEAIQIAETSRVKLHAIYIGRLGSLEQVPVMMIPHGELRWLALDHRAGFVLSLVDGTSTIEEIVDVSTMPRLEVLRTLYNLLTQNVLSLRRPRR